MASPTPSELALVNQLFAVADPQKLNIITGEAALKVFNGTNLSPSQLGEIWQLADSDQNGFLTKKTAVVAVRLIGHAQKGEKITEALVNKPGPLAVIDGVSPPTPPAASNSGLPPFTPQDKAKFLRLFPNGNPINGLMSGDKARDIFLKSKLPYEKLSQIWQLADTRQRGALDTADFSVAMYFVQACMANPSLVLPQTLPPSIYEQAGGKSTPVVAHATGGSMGLPASPLANASFPVPSSIPPIKPNYTGTSFTRVTPQYTGQAQIPQSTGTRPPIPAPSKALGAMAFPNAVPFQQAAAWDVTAQEQASFGEFFRTLDTTDKGYIEGDIAVPFLVQSGLPDDALAQVWDLACIQNDGRLSQDTFAVAMHLITEKLAGKPLPGRLPETLIPPSLRQTPFRPAQPAAPPVSQITRDLFDLDNSPPASPTIPEQATSAFSSSIFQPQSSGMSSSTYTFQSTAPTSVMGTQSPLSRSVTSSAPAPAPMADLLGDDEDSAADNAAIHANAAEIGNLKNLLNSTQRSLKSTQEERKTLEETVAAQAAQLSALQSQLSTASAAYETEKKLLSTLQERMAAQNSDITKTREELIRGESDLSAVKLEKAEVERAVLRDKEDVRELQRKMKEIMDASELLKAEVEKAKKEARQQKGLLAIAKKQLGSSESDKEKAAKELEEAKAELDQLRKEIEEAEAQAKANLAAAEASRTEIAASRAASPSGPLSPAPAEVAASFQIPDTPDITTPASVTSTKSTNPFDRLKFGGTSPSPHSPFQPFSTALPMEMPSVSSPSAEEPASIDPYAVTEGAQNDSPPVSQIQENSLSLFDPPSELVAAPSAPDPVDLFKGDQEPENIDTPTAAAPPPAATENDLFAGGEEIEPDEDSDSDEDEEFHDAKARMGSPTTETPGTATNRDIFAEPDEMDELSSMPLPPGLSQDDLKPTRGGSNMSTFDDAFAQPGERAAEVAKTSRHVSPTASGAASPLRTRSPAVKALSLTPEEAAVAQATPFEPPTEAVVPPPTIETVLDPSVTKTLSGASAFDEAMGRLPDAASSPPAAPAAQSSMFSFESNFDDTFDFGSSAPNGEALVPMPMPMPEPANSPVVNGVTPPVAGASAFPPALTLAPAPNFPVPEPFTHTPSFLPPIQSAGQGLSFDDAFGNPSTPPSSSAQSNGITNGVANKFISFDDAFNAEGNSTETSKSPTSPPKPSIEANVAQRVRTPSPTRRAASPVSPGRTMSSHRSSSPPPRGSSPSLTRRKSSAGHVSDGEKEKRSTKLSIRFPFGRRNKDKEKDKEAEKDRKSKRYAPPPGVPPPTSSQYLSPISEPSGTMTPAVEDDTDALKNLCSMGFSRTQALSALEAHNFDLSKALNSLLATQ